jgi:hypothetical protein
MGASLAVLAALRRESMGFGFRVLRLGPQITPELTVG